MHHLCESELIDRVLTRRDQLAFSELVERNQSKLRYSLRQLTGWDESLADDIAQEAFLKAYQKLDNFQGKAKFSSWLYKIAYHCFLQHCRKQHPILQELDSEEIPYATQGIAAECDIHHHLAMALSSLGVEARSVMHLSLHRQCTHQEIAEIMNIPLGSVKTHINHLLTR